MVATLSRATDNSTKAAPVVAVYLRVSTEEQRERQSISTQREFAERYCSLHQLNVIQVYADDGVSGTIPLESRPEGGRMLKDARSKKFNQILVYKLDRLGRETRLILNGVAELEKDGVRVKSMTEEFDTATSSGRLMLTMLSGFAAHERDVIRERSIAGTNRVAESGAWMGGIVPYGYRKQGERIEGRLVLSETPISGFDQSEVDVVRLIFRMSAADKKSCMKIADFLNRSGIPCTSAWNAQPGSVGKRGRRTSGIWRPSHVRNMIVSSTYMGTHAFGKRTTNPNRKLILREVPPIVPEETWKTAQEVLRSNRVICKRNTRTSYLLRGLIKCGLCGLTYSGMTMKAPQRDHYYRCNGRQFARGLYGTAGKKCPSKNLNGDYIERVVWADIETFLRNPGEILERLRRRLELDGDDQRRREKDLQRLRGVLERKSGERDRILALFRRGRIDETTLDKQMDEIEGEAVGLRAEIDMEARALSCADRREQLSSAEALLANLRKRLDEPIAPDLKRRIVETLVENVRADTVECWGVQQSKITVTYRFAQPNEAAPATLPLSHHLTSRTRLPEKLVTVGDHIRRRRLTLKLLQRQVAKQLDVNEATVHNWETNIAQPRLHFMPAIIRFLGYNPLPPPTPGGWGDRLVSCRTALGVSQKELAGQLAVDPCTLARWERSEREPTGAFKARVSRFLNTAEAALAVDMAQTA
jgi:site-specific DNA recombinase